MLTVGISPPLKKHKHPNHGPLVQGAKTEGRLPQEALVQLGVSLGTVVSESPSQASTLYASLDDARAGATALAGAAARSAAGGYASAMRLQAMMGEVGHSFHRAVVSSMHRSKLMELQAVGNPPALLRAMHGCPSLNQLSRHSQYA